MIDTHSGAGRQTTNRIDCLLKMGRVWPFVRQLHLASFFVASHAQAQSIEGSLIMDFGNSGCSFIFSETGSGAMSSPVIAVHNPFDAEYRKRTPDQLAIFKSSVIVLKVEENPRVAPWLVMGTRSEELIQQHPLATYLYAPKKYIRDWPKHLEARAPKSLYRGVIGQRPDLHPRLEFVKEAVSHLLQLVLSSLTNPEVRRPLAGLLPAVPADHAHLPVDLEGVRQGPVRPAGEGRGARADRPARAAPGGVPGGDDL